MTMNASWGKMGPEETRRNIRIAGDQMGSFVRSTLGPLGRDKMVVRRMSDGDVRAMVTSDGIALIEEFEGETDHPIANRFIELAEAQEDDYGDGTTTVVVLASELLTTGLDLVEEGVHPIDVIEGFSIGAQRTLERWEELAIPLAEDGELDREALRAIAETGMTNGRSTEWPLDQIADEVVEAVLRVSNLQTGNVKLSHANTIVAAGGDVTDTRVLDGAVVPEDPANAEHMLPVSGNVLIVEGDVQPQEPAADVTVQVEDAEGAKAFREAEHSQALAVAERVAEADAAAVVVGGEVSWEMLRAIERTGAVVLRNVKDSRISYLSKATGATPLSGLSPTTEIDPERVGEATVGYHDVKVGEEWLGFTSEREDAPPAATILVRGGTERTAKEAERRIKHGMNALRASVKRPEALPAGGAADVSAALAVREIASGLGGREQLAADAFADVIETIPRQLATNAGHDPVDALTTLRARHDAGHDHAGVATDGELVEDVTADGGFDPFLVRTTSLVRAVEFVTNLLRIDDTLLTGSPDVKDPEELPALPDPEKLQ